MRHEPINVICGLEIYNFLTSPTLVDAFGRGRRRPKFQERIEYEKLNLTPRSKIIVDNDGELKLSRWPPLVAGPTSEQVKSNGWLRLDLTFDLKLHSRVLLVKSGDGTILKAYHLNTYNSGLAGIPLDAIPVRPPHSKQVKSNGVMHGF